jgi:hypothetical protein
MIWVLPRVIYKFIMKKIIVGGLIALSFVVLPQQTQAISIFEYVWNIIRDLSPGQRQELQQRLETQYQAPVPVNNATQVDSTVPRTTSSNTITFPDIKAGYYIKSIDFKRNFNEGEVITFKNLKGIETAGGISEPTPEEGFNVQAAVMNPGTNKNGVLPSINADYDPVTHTWSGTFKGALPAGTYVFQPTLYCSNHTLSCFQTHGDSYEAEPEITFTVGNVTTSSLKLMSPAYASVYKSGQKAVFRWTDSKDAANYSLSLKSASNSQVTNIAETFLRSSGIDGTFSYEWQIPSTLNGKYVFSLTNKDTGQTVSQNVAFQATGITPVACPVGYTCIPLTEGETAGAQVNGCPTGYKCVGSGGTTNTSNCAINVYMGLGSTGEQVAELQKVLLNSGFNLTDERGVYGQSTKEALSKFQLAKGMPSTGFAGPLTIAALCGTSGGVGTVTGEAPKISLAIPNGGETYKAGDMIRIQWGLLQTKPENLNLGINLINQTTGQKTVLANPCYQDASYWDTHDYLKADCMNFSPILNNNFNYIVPSTLATGKYKIQLEVLDRVTKQIVSRDISDAGFTINAAITTTPSASPTNTASSVAPLIKASNVSSAYSGQTVILTTGHLPSTYQYYLYVIGDGWSNTVATTRISDTSLSFKFPTQPVGPVKLVLRVYSGSTLVASSPEFSGFTIIATPSEVTLPIAPAIKIYRPTADEKYIAGNTYSFQYTGGAQGETATLEFVNVSTGAVAGTRTVGLGFVSENYIFFEIPLSTPAGTYNYRMKKSDGTVLASSVAITVSAPEPGVGVVVPDARSYTVGQKVNVYVSASNYPAGTTFDVKLGRRDLVSGSAVETLSTIATGISAPTTYTWTIPTNLASRNDYVILICPSTGGKCGYSLTFKVNPIATQSPIYTSPVTAVPRDNSNFVANVFYSIGDAFDAVF